MSRRRRGNIIEWSDKDEEIRLAQKKRIESSQKPSMWEYNPKGGMPTELANLDPSTFLTSRLGQILCSLPKDLLIRLCSMLSPRDFVHLSETCRFLHWRMFAFCTCYAPRTVKMSIDDKLLNGGNIASAKWIYSLYNGVIYYEENHYEVVLRLQNQPPYNRYSEFRRGLFVCTPFCLRKPVFFDTLELDICSPFFCKKYYDKCLSYILAVRGLARNLDVIFRKEYYSPTPSLNFSHTNDFLTAVKASYYDYLEEFSAGYITNNVNIYVKCAYARKMNRVCVEKHYRLTRHVRLNVPIFENRIGIYQRPLNSTIIATMKNFLAGSTNLIFHHYRDIEENNGRIPLIEYLFEEFGEFEEFLYESSYYEPDYCHIWKKVVETKNGGQLRIIIKKEYCNSWKACVKIGKEETFDEMEKKYSKPYPVDRICWKMETAVEADGTKKPNVAEYTDETEESEAVTVEPKVVVKPTVAVVSNVIEEPAIDFTAVSSVALKPAVTKESAVAVAPIAVVSQNVSKGSKKTEESDEVEEKQKTSRVCPCLNNNSCSIQ